jgi:hypothetical protein
VVGATGREVKARQENGARWVYHFEQGDVHDFAFVADARLAQPLKGQFQGEDGRQVEIRVFYPPEYASNAQAVLAATQQSLAFFEKALGAYPYQTVTAVVPPFNADEAGGMEYPTFFTASSVLNLEAGTTAAYGLDFVTIHEFGHGYFYGILASNEFEEPWLDEGLNEYLNLRMIHDSGRRIPLTTPLLKRLGFAPSIDAFEVDRLMSVQGEPSDALAQNSWNRRSSGSYGSVYNRTATLMRGLQAELGTEALDRALKAYYQQWKFRHPSSADFMAVLVRETGRPDVIQRVFAQQVFDQAQVDDRVVSLQSMAVKPERGWQLQANGRAQRLKEPAASEPAASDTWRTLVELRRFGAAVPQEVVVTFADGSVERVRWDDNSRWKRYSWVKNSKAVHVELDPNRHHSLDTYRLDNSRLATADGRASRRLASDAAALAQSLLALVSML